MAETLTLKDVQTAVGEGAAAFRCRRRLQPAGGEGEKVFPPTFAGAIYACEQRQISGRTSPVACSSIASRVRQTGWN
jgi:CRISPR-associated protein Csb1